MCLQWISGQGNKKQFVSNRVKTINKKHITWKYVPTHENPADIGSQSRYNARPSSQRNLDERSWLVE